MNHTTASPRRTARDLIFVRCPRRVRRALRWHLQAGHRVAFTQLALMAGALLSPWSSWANPSGAQVAAGTVNVVSSVPGTLDIQQGTTKAIINWQSFNIASGETVNFLQPTVTSVTLNRVLGNDPSAIFGRLNANGTVMLVNPNGIVFGPTARVDVGGLVATTANIKDQDFLAGRYTFGEASANRQARIVNAGEISIKDSGLAALVAPSVQNSGVIQARLGRIALGGAQRFTLDFQGDGLLSFAAGSAGAMVEQHPLDADGQPVAALVSNTGTLRADGGTVLMTASAVKGVIDSVINTTGIVSASAVGEQGGRIVLSGGDHGSVAAGGSLSATGAHGGTVTVKGEHVQIASGAVIDVSGTAGGGEIALGSEGRAQGYAHKSQSTTVAAGASLRADALTQGDGGHVTLWSQDTTSFAGSLSARGGAQGGNGGFAEVSSQKNIGLSGSVDLRAPHGATGTLLLDPTDLRITDSPSGGSQDGNATDTSVAAGDANQGSGATLNTVSRGLLEGLSGTANISLQATGQITIDAMAGGLINLATTTGHSVALQSTQSGGIRFVDPATEIRTQGGDITLEAFGIGSTLSNIGKLSSNGGAISLTATGDVQLAGAVNAGGGAVKVQTTVGSIGNAPSTTPLLSGGSVSLAAPGGHLGATGSALNTHTTALTLEAGGNVFASSDTQLASLALTASHASPGTDNTYQLTAPGLTAQINDSGTLGLTQLTQSAGLNLTLATDRTAQVGSVNVGAGTASLASTGGNLLGDASGTVTAASLTLSAQGSNGNNGAIGTSNQALNTATGHLNATAGSGGTFLANTGALALDSLVATGSSSVTSTGTLTAGNVNAGSATLALGSSGGSVLDDGNATTKISAGTLNVTAGGAIGSSGTRLSTTASTLSANAAAGGIYAGTSATSSVLSSVTSGNGVIDITTGGSTTLTALTSSTSSASNDITVAATGTGSMSVGTVNAGSAGDVTLTTTSGSISGSSGLITGDHVTLNAANSGSVSVRTAASHLDVQAGSSSISITQTGAVTLDRIATPSSFVSVTNSSGDITVGSVSTSTSGQVSLTATAGAIKDDGDTATRITTGTASLSASGAIGDSTHAVQTEATGLAVTSTGDLFVTNTDATLTSLSITNRHSAPGAAATLQISSPYLTFQVNDTGTAYELERVVSVPLGSLAFSGDATLQIGQVQAAGSVSLTATQGNLVDDGNLQSRVTSGSTLTLSAAQGSVGSSSNPIGANASSLALTTRGDLYVTDLTDLSTLTLTSSHPDTTTSYGMAITAPSLKLDVTDSAAGHAVHTLTDNSSLSLTFTSDRDITLGRVDVTSTGTARFTSSGGAIKDDGDKSTRVLANSSTFSGSAVGATGTGHLDVVTGTLAASASAGGVYVEVPMPTGSTNTTSTVTLGTVTAAGPVSITALEGDLSLGGFMTATNQPVSLTATQGGIYSPSGYSIGIGTGSLVLHAATAIGTSSRALPVTSSTGATLTAQAGSSMAISASGPMTLSNLTAGTDLAYTQSSGTVTVGSVTAGGTNSASLTATTGSIVDDGNSATGITAQQVNLTASQGAVGAAGAALNINAPKLAVTANGEIAITDAATLDTLAVTRGNTASGAIALAAGAGQSFALSDDGSTHYVQSVSSTTPLAFSFTGPRTVKVGSVSVGSGGSASLTSSGADIVNDGLGGSAIAAGSVALTAGSSGSIGAAGGGNALSLQGTTALNVSAGRHVFAASDAALTDLTITSTNTTTASGTASVFGVSGLGQTFGITDSGTTQSLDFSGTALTNASFTTRKNIAVGALTATGDVTLTTSGGGANSNISSDSGAGTIAGNRVLLTATSSTAGGGNIGSSGTPLRVDTPTVILAGSGNVYVGDAQNLTRLEMTLAHGTDTTFGYGVTAGNINSFAITDGSTQSIGMAVSGAMDFSYSVDRALSLATIDAGTSTTGSISLTSRSAPTGTGAQINRSSGSLTGGSVTLSAVGFNGGVGAGATLSTNTQNLAIATGGNVSVSNSTTLTSLNLDARHNTSGSSTHSYSISSTGLTFSISDTLGNNAFQLSNISQSGLDLSVKADRVITASSINTGAGGKVTLNSGSYIQGGSGANAGSPSITTGDLTLNGGSAFGYQGSTPLYTAAGTLASSLSNTLYLSNAGALTLKTNTVGSSADVASSNNSLLQDSGGLFTTPTLKLSANQSLGSNDTLLTDVRRLTLVARNNIDVSNASDLYALTMTSTHGTAGVQNTISVAAPRLDLTLTDSVGGNQYHLSNLVDSTGLDFTLSTDVALNLGTVNAQAGRALALYSTGSATSITNDGASLLTAGSITLSAGGSIGAAGGSGTRMQTDALGLTLATGANAFADNAQDLTTLSLASSQATGGTAPVYQVTAPSLAFDITDDGTTHINNVADTTGLNFTLNTRRSQAVGSIDVGRSGTVSLTSTGDILGDADSSHRIHAASTTLNASNGGAIGSVGNPIHLSSPLVSFAPTGAMNVESDTHIDRLSISTTHPTVTYGGTYSIVSVPITGAAYPLFTATDSVTGTALTSLDDPLGLAFSFTSDRAMQVGTINLGSTGTVALTGTSSGGILGDGDPNTLVQAASLSMVSYGGAVGATGSGNGIDATVNAVSATAQGGGVTLALHGRTALGSISATGGVGLTNDEGDIALGSINAGGNAVTINNQGGSILSGSISNATTVALTASGSIGNTSAIGTSANGGGTTTLTASASAAHGASGSIALSESYNLFASSVTAPAAVTLSSGYGLLAGTLTSGGAVALSSSQGSINGTGGNAITGTSVNLSARYGTGNGIGNSEVRLNVNTPQLVLNTPGSVYVTDSADLNLLTLDRTNYTGTGSSGTLSVIASGLTFSASDSSNTTTLTSLADGTGLDFTYLGIGALSVGSLNVGAGSMLLQGYLSSGDGNINAINSSSLITAGSLTLQAYGTGSTIGSSGTALGLAVGSLTASSGTGGMHLQQAGSLNLSSLATTGDLAVTATSGDLTLGTLSYGSAKTLNLTASGGSILAGGGTLAGSGAGAAITLSAANGIGTSAAPVQVNASAGHTVNASVTGTGSLYLNSLGTLNGGLTTAVNNGATNVTAAGNITLTSMTSATDAAGNDIRVTASAGDITAVNVSGGSNASFNEVNLAANAGRLIATASTTLAGYDVTLHGATGVGDTTHRISASGQRVQVTSNGGALYLTANSPSVLSYVASNGGAIDVTTTADLLLANAASSGGAITVSSSTANVDLSLGNLNAGSGSVTVTSSGSGGTLQDDGNRATRVAGASVSLTGANGVGTSALSVQTSAAVLNASSANGIFIDDGRSAGTTLASVVASSGAVSVSTAGPTVATLVQATADGSGNNVTLSTSSGDLTLVQVQAGATQGAVNLQAAGSILSGNASTAVVVAHSAGLTAGGDIGVVTDLATGAGTPVGLDVSTLGTLASSGTNRVVSVSNINGSALTLGGGALSLGSGSSAYVSTAGDLDVSAGIALANGNLSLSAGGTLTLPTSALSTSGAVRLAGSTDIVTSASGAAARDLHISANSLYLRSGAAGGSTTLTTTVGSLDAALSGAGNLTVANTGTLSATTLATSNGDINATSSTGMTAGSVTAGGSGRHIGLTATAGDLTVGTINAGSGGSITLAAAAGALNSASAALTASTLGLTSGSGIGSSGAAFATSVANVSAQVTGTGGIYLAPASTVTLGQLTTHDGDISVAGSGSVTSSTGLSAGNGGALTLTSTGGDVTVAHAITQAGSATLQGQHISVQAVTTTGAQSYTGPLTLGGDLAGASILVNGNATLADGARTLTGGLHVTGTLAGGGNTATLNAGSGAVVLDGAASGLAALTVSAGSIQLASVTTTGGAQSYTGATTLNGSYATQGGGFSVSGATHLGGATLVATAGGQASFGGTLNGAAALSVNTGAGNASFGGAVGQTTRLGDLSVTSAGATHFDGAVAAASVTTDAAGTLALNGGSVNTTGSQTYGERAVLGSDTVLTGSTLTLSQGADAAVAGQQGLTLNGQAILPAALGANAALKSLTVSGDTTLNGGTVTTSGAQSFAGALTLGADTVLSGTSIAFGSTVNGAQALTVQAGTGDATFAGSVGGITRLGALTINSSGATTLGASLQAASVTTDAAGTLALNGGTVNTTGTQSFGERAVLGANTTLTGTTVTLQQGADAASAGAQSLTINGNAVVNGAIGQNAALASLAVSGGAALNGGSGPSSVATSGAQQYSGAVTLGADTALTAQGVAFGSSVDGATSGLALTVNAGAGGAGFGGAVGTTTRLGALVINSSGATTLGAAVQAASVTTDAAGTLALNGGTVNTTGAQSFGERAALGANTTLTGTTVTLQQGADAASAGAQGLTIAGNAVVNGAIGQSAALASLAVSGDAALNGGSVASSGAQQYSGAVTLGADTTLAAQGVAFGSTVNGAQALTVDAGTGDATFAGSVGGITRLGALTINSSGATTLGAALQAASVTTDAAGTLALNGGMVNTTGAQSFGERAVLGANTTLTGSSVTLAAGADALTAGTQALTISGNAVAGGAVGGQAALAALTVSGSSALNGGSVRTSGAQQYGAGVLLGADTTMHGSTVSLLHGVDAAAAGGQGLTISGNALLAGEVGAQQALAFMTLTGPATLGGGAVRSTGDQRYEGELTLAGDQRLAASAGTVALLGGVNGTSAGSEALTLSTGSRDITLASAMGAAVRLGALTINSSGATTLGAAIHAASVTTDAAGTLALNGGTVDTTGTQTYGERAVLGANTTLTGSTVTLQQGADGASAGAQSLTIAGNAVISGAVGAGATLASLAVSGDAALNGGSVASSVTTSGAQQYSGALTLGADTTLAAQGVTFGSTVNGAQALTVQAGAGDATFAGSVGGITRLGALVINSSGATTLGGAVQATSVSTDAAGTLALNGGQVHTTGTQTYGERAVLGADTVLTGSSVSLLAGADAATSAATGGQGLDIVGNAVLGGAIGAQQALSHLSVSGAATLAAGSVATAGDQSFVGAVQLLGDQTLHSTSGSVTLASTVDSTGRANLTLGSDAGAVAVGGDIGGADNGALGALTVHAGTTLDFSGSVRAYRLQQTAGGLARWRGAVWVDGPDGIDVSGAGLALPASVFVVHGPITVTAPATLPGGNARIETEGTITIAGLYGPATALTLASGHGQNGSVGAGKLLIGRDGGSAAEQLNVANLAVPDAAAARLYGLIGGQGGPLAASRINSYLVNDPYFMNGTPWGPVEVINRLVATTVPTSVVPSTPGVQTLFTGAVSAAGITPNALGAYAAPQVLTVSSPGNASNGRPASASPSPLTEEAP